MRTIPQLRARARSSSQLRTAGFQDFLRLVTPALAIVSAMARLPAQPTTVGSLETTSNMGALLVDGRVTTYKFVRQGYKASWVGQSLRISADARGASRYGFSTFATLTRDAQKMATATLGASGITRARTLPARFTTSNVLPPRSPTPGVVSVRFVHPFANTTKRDFRFEFTARWSGSATSTVGASVDIGDNNTIDWRPTIRNGVPVRKKLTLPAGPKGIVIRLLLRVSQTATATGTMGMRATLRYSFRSGQQSCTLRPNGPRCGPQLTGSLTTPLGPLNIQSSGATAKSVGVWILGFKSISVPIPGTNCLLLTSPDALGPHGFDARGTARLHVPIPPRLQGFLSWQDAVLTPGASGLRLQTTQSLHLRCLEK